MQPQEAENLQVTLQPGEYKVYCPVGSHEVKGMKMTLTVTPDRTGEPLQALPRADGRQARGLSDSLSCSGQ